MPTTLFRKYLTEAEADDRYDALGAAAAAAAGAQPLDSDLTAIAALTTTAYGRAFLALADAAAGRTALSLGTLATQSGTFSGTSSGTNTGDQTLYNQTVEDEGTPVTQRGTVNFTGAGVSVADTGGKTTVTIAGGAGEAFPVGSIYLAVVSTNPNTLLGYGTWSAIGAGRVLVGLDSGDTDFDTVEETGGAKTKAISAHAGTAVADHAAHTHSVTSNVTVADHASHTHTYTDVVNHTHPQTSYGTATGGSTGWTVDTSMSGSTTTATQATGNPSGGVATGTTAGPNATLTHSPTNNAVTSGNPSATLTHGVTQPDAHTDLNVVQPYFVCYMWKRTA